MAITLTRTSTPRFGSRNWAKAQTGEWTATRSSWACCEAGWEIKINGKLIAVLTDEMVGERPSQIAQDYMINYGSDANLGNALFGDLCEALETLAADDADDAEPITFTRS